MKTIPSNYAAEWIQAMFLVDAVLTKARLCQPITWTEAYEAHISLEKARKELMIFAVTDVAVETREAA
jgi:hypothetical protein